MAAQQAVHFIGMPEGALALAQAAVYLAIAPKSNALYRAYKAVQQDVADDAQRPRAAAPAQRADRLMKGLGYGKGYRYAHDADDAVVAQEHLPDNLQEPPLLPADRPRRRGAH